MPKFHRASLIDGKKIAADIEKQTRECIARYDLHPGLAAILVGDDAASKLYVSLKEKAAKKIGIDFHTYLCTEKSTPDEIMAAVKFLNRDPDIAGIIVQLPLPKHLDTDRIIDALDPEKDVDGFHKKNLSAFLENRSDIPPVLTSAIVKMLDFTAEPLTDKHAAIVSNSEIFAKPLMHQFQKMRMTAEWCGANDSDIKNKTLRSDVLIVAVGKPSFITAEMVKQNAIVIDVGTTKTEHGIEGDVDFANVEKIASWISPVPGGVGPVTVAMLLANTVTLALQRRVSRAINATGEM